jgi:hypothetical protein
MLKNALYVALIAEIVFLAWLVQITSAAMRPYTSYFFATYGIRFAAYAVAHLFTLTLSLMLIFRFIWLKDSGKKLEHATKELKQGGMHTTPDSLLSLIKGKH